MATLKSWNEIPIGGLIVEAGNAVNYKTGGWRAFRPIVTLDKCTHCLMCWLYCPEVSMMTEGGQFVGVDLDHCKGCGLCVKVCPPKCIEMVEEGKVARG